VQGRPYHQSSQGKEVGGVSEKAKIGQQVPDLGTLKETLRSPVPEG
jgi:hypothetical protein